MAKIRLPNLGRRRDRNIPPLPALVRGRESGQDLAPILSHGIISGDERQYRV
jgi:hypothetical protein